VAQASCRGGREGAVCKLTHTATKEDAPWPGSPADNRYDTMTYNRVGKSGLKLPAISLGLWHNFGHDTPHDQGRRSAARPSTSASPISTSPTITARRPAPRNRLRRDPAHRLPIYRDELIISSKAGYDMWPGPYGEWGSRKYLIASCDQSLKRMGLDYVDIFYSHRFDPDTPLEETCGALDHIVRSGRALYVGISSYNSKRTREAAEILKALGTPCIIHQPSYSMINRWIEEDGLVDAGRAWHRLDRLLAAGAGHADLEISERHSGRHPRGVDISLKKDFILNEINRHYPQAEPHRRAARPDAGADGSRLGAARRRITSALIGASVRRRWRIASRRIENPTLRPKNSPRSTSLPKAWTSTLEPVRPNGTEPRLISLPAGPTAGRGPAGSPSVPARRFPPRRDKRRVCGGLRLRPSGRRR
jgi:hypothetical protein